MTYDTNLIKQEADLIAIIEEDLGPGQKNGHWMLWCCPFHDDKTPSFAVGPENQVYKCFGCGETGDVLTWGTKFRKLSFKEWCAALSNGNLVPPAQTPIVTRRAPRSPAINDDWPDTKWQDGLFKLMLECHKLLYKPPGQQARQWLLGPERSLMDETLQRYWIGFNPTSRKIFGHWVYAGIIIPHYSKQMNAIFGIKIRLSAQGRQDWLRLWQQRNPDKNPAQVKIPKYVSVKGGKPNLFNIDSVEFGKDDGFYYVGTGVFKEHIFICEGEFDCMLLEQESGDLVAPLTLGAASARLGSRWLPALKNAKRFHLCQDADQAGQVSLDYWRQLTGQRSSVAVLPPGVGDITDLVKAGHDLREWVQNELKY